MTKKYAFLTVFLCSMCPVLMAGDPTLDRLIENMSTSDANVRAKAKHQLHYLCRRGHDDLLHTYLKSEKTEQRYAAVIVASSIKPSKETLDLVASCLSEEDSALKRQAAKCLGGYKNKSASEYLAKALSGDAITRIVVMDAIATGGQDVGASVLAAQLKDTDFRVRFSAANALYLCKASGQESALKAALSVEKENTGGILYTKYKEKIIVVLQASLLIAGDSEGKEMVSSFVSEDSWVRDTIVEAHVIAKDKSLVPVCFKTMTNKNEYIRQSAAKGLTALSEVKDIPKILDLINTEVKPEVRQELSNSLRRLSGLNYGYNGYASKALRDAAETRWREWWKNNAYRYKIDTE